MDPKVIEMNNLRVLNDYLNQTIDVLVRGPRSGNGHSSIGYSPFGSMPSTAATMGTDVYGPFAGSPAFGGIAHTAYTPYTPYTAQSLFGGLPMTGFGAVDPFLAQRGFAHASFGAWQPAWGQQAWGGQPTWGQQAWGGQPAWSPTSEVARHAQLNQALVAKQSVLESICRCAGIPV